MSKAEHDRVGALIDAENRMMEAIKDKFIALYGPGCEDELKLLIRHGVEAHLKEMKAKGLLRYTEFTEEEPAA